ncbi:MAG: GGDEF domain-containing protein [Pseudomonadota bacterium]
MDIQKNLIPDRNLAVSGQREALLAALLEASASLSKEQEVGAILRSFCDALVAASPEIRMAWIYVGERDPEVIRPLYVAGPAHTYAAKVAIGRDPRAMQGPARRTLASGRPITLRVASAPEFELWREEALAHGIRSVVSIAFQARGAGEAGVFALGAGEEDYFEQLGLDAFQAFARLCEVALTQAAAHRQLEQLATSDPLTGLLNRRALEARIAQEHARAQRSQRPYSLLLFDLDRFKLVNDLYGHSTGDAVLVRVTEAARAILRQTDHLGRWGGEEFLCLMPDTDSDAALSAAERLRHLVMEQPISWQGRPIPISISAGLVSFPLDGDTPDALLAKVDAALYEAKREGRNRVRRNRGGENSFSLANQMEMALHEGRIRPAYQSIVDLQSGQVVAEEALARLLATDGSVLEAGRFIDAAHQLQIVHRVDHAVIRQVLQRCSLQMQSGIPLAHFVNISTDLLRHAHLVEDLLACAQDHCHACGDLIGKEKPLVIEITEREFLEDTQRARRILTPFLDFGIRLAIDDFGSGYSSFRYLTDLPISFLKLEGELVRRVAREEKARIIIRRIQDIACDLGLVTIAEYVESAETAAMLRDMGVNWAQGYHFGRPRLETLP